MNNICVFGDSLVWGARDLKIGGWVNRLRLWFDDFDDNENQEIMGPFRWFLGR